MPRTAHIAEVLGGPVVLKDPITSADSLRAWIREGQAVEVLGSKDKASQWLQRPNRALGGETPLSLLDTDFGTRQVEEVMGRLEHGVYS